MRFCDHLHELGSGRYIRHADAGGVFATNRDGSPDAGDAYFSEIKLMVANADEAPSVGTPAQAGTTWSFESRRHATLWS